MRRKCLNQIIASALLVQFVVGGCHSTDGSTRPGEQDYVEICESIAEDIELLKDKFPRLVEFAVSDNLDKESCKIEYAYKCHRSRDTGGWSSGVPNPDPDGIWFYIGFWDEDDPTESSAQINTQPVFPEWYMKDRRVTYLMMEGEKAGETYQVILDVLKDHGLKGPG